MFGKHTPICQLLSPIVNVIFLHITLQYYQERERERVSHLFLCQSVQIDFLQTFIFCWVHFPRLLIKRRGWREAGRENVFQIILLALRLNWNKHSRWLSHFNICRARPVGGSCSSRPASSSTSWRPTTLDWSTATTREPRYGNLALLTSIGLSSQNLSVKFY